MQEAPTSAHNKVDDLRKTAAVQTAMGMAYSLTSTVTSLGSKTNIALPESVTESVSKCVAADEEPSKRLTDQVAITMCIC